MGIHICGPGHKDCRLESQEIPFQISFLILVPIGTALETRARVQSRCWCCQKWNPASSAKEGIPSRTAFGALKLPRAPELSICRALRCSRPHFGAHGAAFVPAALVVSRRSSAPGVFCSHSISSQHQQSRHTNQQQGVAGRLRSRLSRTGRKLRWVKNVQRRKVCHWAVHESSFD